MLSKKELKELFEEHKTNEKGLDSEEIEARRKEHGWNQLKEKKKKPLIIVFLEEFKDLLVIILIIAAVLALIAGEIADGIVILSVVFLNATIGFIQKFKAEKAIEALKKLVSPHAKVMRNGRAMQVEAKDLVPGDILILSEGDSVTADAVLFEANELEAAEAALTGESTPVSKHTVHESKENEIAAEKVNMVFMGTNITHGSGKAVVVATGMKTQMGKIAELTSTTKKDKSPLEKELHRIGIFVGKVALAISVILFIVGFFLQGKALIENILFASSVAVAAVPEGLPATVTIALAIGVQRLARKNAIVKQLSATETLGSTTVICSDKTGTLTKNEMTVKELYFNDHEASVHGVGYAPKGYLNIQENGKKLVSIGQNTGPYDDYEITTKSLDDLEKEHEHVHSSLKLFMAVSSLCNNASLSQKNNKWQAIGDPTEAALLTLAEKSGFTKKSLEKEFERVIEISFDSDRKMMTVIVKNKEGKYFALTKGAPNAIFEKSSTFLQNGKHEKFDSSRKMKNELRNDDMAKNALRVLAFAYRELDKDEIKKLNKEEKVDKKSIEKDLTFLGLVGMIDPPRPEVKDAVQMAKQAHLRVYVITGDHGLTAAAIAKQLTIISDDREHKIITGVELNKLSDDELREDLSNKKLDVIFARVSPEHKLRIVKMLKKLDEIVAVTGDGVNDAPALKKADIGVAMGITGTDVSKEASNMVLADDSFSSIITAIKEGRTIYDNLKKFVYYMFSCNIGELVTIFTAIILGITAPLTAILILIINLGTDILPALALGVDPSEPGIMEKPPRDPKSKIMNKSFVSRFVLIGVAIGFVVMGIYIFGLYEHGWTWGQELAEDDYIHVKGASMAFVSLIVIQMIQAFNARSNSHSIFKLGFFSNWYLIGAILSSLVMAVAMVEIPFFQKYLHTTSLSLIDWAIITASAIIILFVEEIRKVFIRRKLAKAEG
ncbi:HAD-IC family P-type ATPase [Candidatus Peregrinibacteria bacterium]|nr:HAD-IC family P-type ATPase [Candidatus Peregrinibacteria bacterium]